MRRASAIRRGQPTRPNLVAARLKAARYLQTPPLSIAETSRRATQALGLQITRIMVAKIEANLRSVYDFEVVALAIALDVDTRYLLGIIDDPHPEAATSSKQKGADDFKTTVLSRESV